MIALRRIIAPNHCRLRAAAAAAGACAAATATAAASNANATCEKRRKLQVLVTGFNDWRSLEGNIWRCRDNPSCRLILGKSCNEPPLLRNGPLVRALRDSCGPGDSVEFSYQTLPVTWNTAAGLDLMRYDVVIHLGLGVYDCYDTILLEHNAYNKRSNAPDV